MITLALASEVEATRLLVWEALADPEQVARWRPGLLGTVSAQPAWPQPGSSARWRCRLERLPVPVRHRVLELVPGERLRGRLDVGLFRCEETFTLASLGPRRTRVGVRIAAAGEMPVLGGTLDRFGVRRFAAALAAASLRGLGDWCPTGQSGRSADATLGEHRPVVRSDGVPTR